MADFRVYDRVLSQAEIWSLYAPQTRWQILRARSTKRYFVLGALNSYTASLVGRSHVYGSFGARASGSARLALFSYAASMVGRSSLFNALTSMASGKSSNLNAYDAAAAGKASQFLSAESTAAGRAHQLNSFKADATGNASQFNSFESSASGRSMVIYIPATSTASGLFHQRNAFDAQAIGKASIKAGFTSRASGRASGLSPQSSRMSGVSHLFNGFTQQARGAARIMLGATASILGAFRQANDSLDRFELYVGEDASPDLDASPAATSATLPMTHDLPVPLTGSIDYHVVVRRRNAYDLASQNVYERIITINADGTQDLGITAPTATTLTAIAGASIRLASTYHWQADDSPADRWAIYVTSNGDTPDPLVHTPALVAVSYTQQAAKLIATLGPYSEGATIKALVRMQRQADGAQSQNVDVYTATASSAGPDVITQTDPFLGSAHRSS